MPPVMRPYSAGRPPVLTSISSTKSKLSCLPFSPRSAPVVFSPSMMYWFSAPVDPRPTARRRRRSSRAPDGRSSRCRAEWAAG